MFRIAFENCCEKPPSKAWTEYLSGVENKRNVRALSRCECNFNPSLFALTVERILSENGVHILYGTDVAGEKHEKNKLTHVIVENKSGRLAYNANSFIDATGNAVLFNMCDAPCVENDEGNILAVWHYRIESGKSVLKMLGYCEDAMNKSEYSDLDFSSRYDALNGEALSRMTLDSHNLILDSFLADGALSMLICSEQFIPRRK